MDNVPPESEPRPLFSIGRILCHRAHVSELSGGASTSVSVYDTIRRTTAALGNLISTRSVGHFVVRLVRQCEQDIELWRIIETDSRNKKVVILTYDSATCEAPTAERASHAATQYAADATEADLISDFDPASHFFGERRLPRASVGAS